MIGILWDPPQLQFHGKTSRKPTRVLFLHGCTCLIRLSLIITALLTTSSVEKGERLGMEWRLVRLGKYAVPYKYSVRKRRLIVNSLIIIEASTDAKNLNVPPQLDLDVVVPGLENERTKWCL